MFISKKDYDKLKDEISELKDKNNELTVLCNKYLKADFALVECVSLIDRSMYDLESNHQYYLQLKKDIREGKYQAIDELCQAQKEMLIEYDGALTRTKIRLDQLFDKVNYCKFDKKYKTKE